ncbi:MAG: S41 family peptidase, partial [Lachnospiraceae bacterium]|nr:S41 family peptidase [Lachnospiraceae bacterium]
LMNHLKKVHPMFRDGLTEDVKSAYLQALERLKTADTITVNNLRREIQSVLHPMYDAHTSTYNNYPDDKYLKAFPQKNDEGYRVTSINGKSVGQIFEDAKQYACYETEDWISIDLASLASLDFYGFHSPFSFEWTNGENMISETYSQEDFVSWNEFLEIRNQYAHGDDKPQEFVSYEIDEEKSLALLMLAQCNYNQTYIDCVRSMFVEVLQKDIQNVAVDLRGNGGGSSRVGNEFIKYLPVDYYFDGPYDWRWGFLSFHSNGRTTNGRYKELMFDGNVYILTDRESFSAAKDFAMLIQDNHLGKIVGTPSANTVNGYGEIAVFYLPNTGMFVQISTKKWYRIDETNTNSYVMPDYPCDSQSVMETLYEVIDQ